MEEKEFRLAYDMVKGKRMRGLLVEEAAEELGVSPRSIFRMIKDGRLKAEKWGLLYGKNRFYWLIDPVSVAKLLLQREKPGSRKQYAKLIIKKEDK
jgi:excisionase family DNA binding protein